METRPSAERYNPITGTGIPATSARTNTSAIFGGSPGAIDYMFIPPSATTRPTKPSSSTEKRRSLSRESLRRSIPSAIEGQPDSDEERSSVSDLSECGTETDQKPRRKSNALSKPGKPLSRSASSRLPVSVSKPRVMKRAHSFTRETTAPPVHEATKDAEITHSASDLTNQPKKAATTLRIPKKTTAGTRSTGPQSSRIPLKRADVNSNTDKGLAGNEGDVSKRTTTDQEARASGIPVKPTAVQKRTSEHLKQSAKETTATRTCTTSGIPVKSSGNRSQQHSGNSKIPQAKQEGSQVSMGSKAKEDNTRRRESIGKENDGIKIAEKAEKQLIKREGTGDELRTNKTDGTKSKLPRRSSIPRGGTSKTSQQKTKTEQTAKTNEDALSGKKDSHPAQRGASKTSVNKQVESKTAGDPSTTFSTAFQRSDSGFGDTDSISSKDDTPFETGNEFSISRENSRSKIPVMSRKSPTVKKKHEVVTRVIKDAKAEEVTRNEKLQEESKPSSQQLSKKLENTELRQEHATGKASITREEDSHHLIDSQISKPDKPVTAVVNDKQELRRLGTEKMEISTCDPACELPSNEQGALTAKKSPAREKNVVLHKRSDIPSETKGEKVGDKFIATRFPDSSNSNLVKDVGDSSAICLDDKTQNIEKSASANQHESSLISGNRVQMENTKAVHDEARNGLKEPGEDNSNVGSKSTEVVKFENAELTDTKTTQTTRVETTPYLELDIVSTSLNAKSAQKKKNHDLVESGNYLKEENNQLEEANGHLQNSGLNVENSASPHKNSVGKVKNDLLPDKAKYQKPGDLRLQAMDAPVENVGLNKDDMKSEVGGNGKMKNEKPENAQVLQSENYLNCSEAGVEEFTKRSDVCFECRFEKSGKEDVEGSEMDDDIRRYPTFISPRKSLVFCKHHQKLTSGSGQLDSEKPLVPMTSLSTARTCQISDISRKTSPEAVTRGFATKQMPHDSVKQGDRKDKNDVIDYHINSYAPKRGTAVSSFDTLQSSTLKSKNAIATQDAYPNIKNEPTARSSDQRRPTENNARENGTKDVSKTGPTKGSHSPLLALSRDKKFVSGENISTSKNTDDMKSALSLEWDDVGTELSPPNFSDEDDEILGPGPKKREQDDDDSTRPGVKLMNTNEALDKLKMIQTLIMKEAESRSRRESEESAGKLPVGGKGLGEETTKNAGNAEKERLDGEQTSRKEGSTSNQVSPTFERPERKVSSPTIWDRIGDKPISQDQTTELLNETLAKLKASPQLSSNAFARRTLSSRSLPGSRQASKEQLLSDTERPVYVYTSSWMNTSGRNSRGSSLSLCSANRSLPSSRQNLTKDPFTSLPRSESASGRMEKENGKRIEGKEKKEFRLSDFDEVTLSDDGNQEVKNQKTNNPTVSTIREKPYSMDKKEKSAVKTSKRKKKAKNTAATMNNFSPYQVSMEELADDKTKCHCGGKNCIIS